MDDTPEEPAPQLARRIACTGAAGVCFLGILAVLVLGVSGGSYAHDVRLSRTNPLTVLLLAWATGLPMLAVSEAMYTRWLARARDEPVPPPYPQLTAGFLVTAAVAGVCLAIGVVLWALLQALLFGSVELVVFASPVTPWRAAAGVAHLCGTALVGGAVAVLWTDLFRNRGFLRIHFH